MKARFIILLTTLAFLGLSISVPAFAGKDKGCGTTNPHPSCGDGGGGGGGDDHGDPPAQYCAELTSGGFDFGTETVTRNNRGNEYNSPVGLEMDRSDSYSPEAWDAVFATCEVLKSRGLITELTVSDKWAISNSGAQSIGEPFSPVLVSLKNAYNSVHYPDIEVDLHLRGELPLEGFPLGPGGPNDPPPYVVIELPQFWFYVHAAGTESCKILSWFSDEGVPISKLKMTWGPCSDE